MNDEESTTQMGIWSPPSLANMAVDCLPRRSNSLTGHNTGYFDSSHSGFAL